MVDHINHPKSQQCHDPMQNCLFSTKVSDFSLLCSFDNGYDHQVAGGRAMSVLDLSRAINSGVCLVRCVSRQISTDLPKKNLLWIVGCNGMVVLGAPLGDPEFVAAHGEKREKHFREVAYLPHLFGPSAALLRSQAGRNAAWGFTAMPLDAGRRIQADRFRVVLCRRLRPPLLLARRTSEGCGNSFYT